MRRRLLTLFAVAMTAITLLTPSFASAGQSAGLPENVVYDESTRSAITISRHEAGCIMTEIFLGLTESRQTWNDGSNGDYRIVSFGAFQYDACQDEVLFNLEHSTDQMAFDVHQHLSGASVSGEFVADNIAGDDLPVSIGVMWSPAGPRVFHEFTDETVVTNPLTGEDVPVLQQETQIDRAAKARGTITIGEQTFKINERGEDTFFVRFDLTWTMQAQ